MKSYTRKALRVISFLLLSWDRMTRSTFVLLETIKSGRVDSHHMLAEPVDLPRNGPPEDLIEHGVRHVVVAATPPVFRHSKRMLYNHVSPD